MIDNFDFDFDSDFFWESEHYLPHGSESIESMRFLSMRFRFYSITFDDRWNRDRNCSIRPITILFSTIYSHADSFYAIDFSGDTTINWITSGVFVTFKCLYLILYYLYWPSLLRQCWVCGIYTFWGGYCDFVFYVFLSFYGFEKLLNHSSHHDYPRSHINI